MDRAGGELTEPDPAVTATLPALLAVFLKLGMTSFGGGLSGWMNIEVVQKRRWLTEEQFIGGVALTQVMPGPNSVNLALYIGQKLRGGPGLVVSGFGVLFPPFLFILLLAALYTFIEGRPGVQFVLSGMAAAGVGLTMVTGVRSALLMRGVAPIAIAVALFVGVGLLHWPMVPLVLALAPLSIWLSWHESRRPEPRG